MLAYCITPSIQHRMTSQIKQEIQSFEERSMFSKPKTCDNTRNTNNSKKSMPEFGNKIAKGQISSKRTEDIINPRVARRMKKVIEETQATAYKCTICLAVTEDEFGRLECGHEFCMPCLTRWWRHHSTCPCCREQIDFITCKNRTITLADLPPEEIDENKPFIAHCQLCWGEIEPHQPMNICTVCRSVYWHSRCLPFKSRQWYCQQCAGEDDGKEK